MVEAGFERLKFPSGAINPLVYLGKSVGIPKEYETLLRKIQPDFVVSRYPDVAQSLPYELYDEEIAKERITIARKVIEWVKKELER